MLSIENEFILQKELPKCHVNNVLGQKLTTQQQQSKHKVLVVTGN